MIDLRLPRQATFAKQANIAHGSQQFNNGISAAGVLARSEKIKTEQSELLEAYLHRGKAFDGAAAERHDQRLEALREGLRLRATLPEGAATALLRPATALIYPRFMVSSCTSNSDRMTSLGIKIYDSVPQ